jgi:hypothetical protein
MIGLGDFVSYLPGNQQDLSLPGSRQAYQSPHTVTGAVNDWEFLQSPGTEVGRFSMAGPLPGRYYGIPWSPPSSGSWLASNSGTGFDTNSSIYSDVGPVGAGSPVMGLQAAQAPAANVVAAQATGQPLGPVSITTPMASVLQPRANQVTPSQLQPCALAQWVNANPILAVGAVAAIYFLMRGSK